LQKDVAADINVFYELVVFYAQLLKILLDKQGVVKPFTM